MKVLIADDDPVARLVLNRVLQRVFPCAVTEVDNGLDALECLERSRYGLVLLDLLMPAMSGVEVLQAIRSSVDLRDLPVVIVSSVKDERGVAEVIRLGIDDYLTKPLSYRVADRLSRVLQRTNPGHTDDGRHTEMCFAPGRRLLIVDGNDDFLHFFVNVMGPRNPVVDLASGVRALKHCLESPPSAAFIGTDTGPLGPDALVRKLRELGKSDHTTLIGTCAKSMVSALRQKQIFDKVIAQTFVPEVLLRQLDEVFSVRPLKSDFSEVLRAMRRGTLSATEQVFGMMLGIDLTVGEGPLPGGPTVSSTVDITKDDGRLGFRLHIPMVRAREFTKRLLTLDEVSDEDTLSGVSEICNIITGRLQKILRDSGATATCGFPSVHILDNSPDIPPDTRHTIGLCFASETGETLFAVELTAGAPGISQAA